MKIRIYVDPAKVKTDKDSGFAEFTGVSRFSGCGWRIGGVPRA